jgi:hypothetical protein
MRLYRILQLGVFVSCPFTRMSNRQVDGGVVMGGLVGVVVGGLLASFTRPYRYILPVGVAFGALLSLSL